MIAGGSVAEPLGANQITAILDTMTAENWQRVKNELVARLAEPAAIMAEVSVPA